MNTDFLDAHHRHWEDAELLFHENRWANADQLYGLAAECGLKRLMIAFGMRVESGTGDPANKNDREHARKIWQRYESYRSGHYLGVSFPLPDINPFNNWNISQRYAHHSYFTQEIAQPHRDGARYVRALINKAILEGIVV